MLELQQEQTRFGFGENDGSFSVGEKNPWHKIGTYFEDAPTIEEGIKAAGLDYDVEMRDIQTTDGIQIPGKAVVRTDKNLPLGIVSGRYNILQNRDAFKFFEPFIDCGDVKLESAGSLYNGRKVYILGRLSDGIIDVAKNDQVIKYVLLSNSHDGSSAVRIGFTAVRVVCQNTLTTAHTADTSKLIRVYHTGKLSVTMEQLRETMDMANQQFITTAEKYKQLAQMPMNVNDFKKYVKVVASKDSIEKMLRQIQLESIKKEEKEAKEQAAQITQEDVEQARKRLVKRAEEIFEMEPVKTRWTAYNSVNYFLNHEKSRNDETKYNSFWFGDSKTLDARAFDAIQRI